MVDGQSSSLNHPTTATTGGASGKPSPANNVGGGTGWGDKGFTKGGINQAEGEGHIAAPNPRSTMGSMLGLETQKTRAKNKYMLRAELAGANVKPMSESGQPTCASEDHSFMGRKPGSSATLPGWNQAKKWLGDG